MKDTATLGFIGVTSTWGTAAYAFFNHATAILSFFSVLLGLIIGIWTLVRMYKYPPESRQ